MPDFQQAMNACAAFVLLLVNLELPHLQYMYSR